MSEKPENPPVFPSSQFLEQAARIKSDGGISLRDYFAAAALQGMCTQNLGATHLAEYPDKAYRLADAMLKARQS